MPSTKGSKSKTHKGDMDYTTKRGDADFHQKGHNVKKLTIPYAFLKGGKIIAIKNITI